MKKTLENKAKQIADIIKGVDTDLRGNLFELIGNELKHDTQYYTGNLFHKMSRVYGLKEEDQ